MVHLSKFIFSLVFAKNKRRNKDYTFQHQSRPIVVPFRFWHEIVWSFDLGCTRHQYIYHKMWFPFTNNITHQKGSYKKVYWVRCLLDQLLYFYGGFRVYCLLNATAATFATMVLILNTIAQTPVLSLYSAMIRIQRHWRDPKSILVFQLPTLFPRPKRCQVCQIQA